MKLKIILSIAIILVLFIGVSHAAVNPSIGWHDMSQIARTGTTGIDNNDDDYIDYAQYLMPGSWGPNDLCHNDNPADYNCASQYYQRSDSDFFIDYSNDEIGIGTSTPEERLEIRDDSDSIRIRMRTVDPYDIVIGGYQGTTQKLGIGYDDSADAVSLSYGSMGNNHITIDSGGEVGIGMSPNVALDVSGTIEENNKKLCKQDGTDCPPGGTSGVLTINGELPTAGGNVELARDTQTDNLVETIAGDGNNNVLFYVRTPGLDEVTGVSATTDDRVYIEDSTNYIEQDSGNLRLATTDDSSIIFRTNGSDRMWLSKDGRLQINYQLRLATSYPFYAERQNVHGDVFLLHNAYYSSSAELLKWVTDHDTFGSRGIRMSYQNGISFYADRVDTTPGLEFTPTRRMIINNNGNVGIGYSAPLQKLDVAGAIRTAYDASSGRIYVPTATNEYLGIINDGGASAAIKTGGIHIGGAYDGATPEDGEITTSNNNNIEFKPNDVEKMRIEYGGDVGIGTTNPSYKLDVSGDIRATGDLRAGDDLFVTDDGTISGSLSVAGTITENSKTLCKSDGTNCPIYPDENDIVQCPPHMVPVDIRGSSGFEFLNWGGCTIYDSNTVTISYPQICRDGVHNCRYIEGYGSTYDEEQALCRAFGLVYDTGSRNYQSSCGSSEMYVWNVDQGLFRWYLGSYTYCITSVRCSVGDPPGTITPG
ncbi:hypothetical protein ACFLQN_04710 [Candidatus Aenigmatarchaeota archaeon]